jgi:hypothetical protein
MRRAAACLLSVAVAAVAWNVVSVRTVSANTFLPCHDNTTASDHVGHWTHGDPATGIPGDPSGGSGYYYLSVKACGPILEGTVYSPGEWDIDISPNFDHTNELANAQFHGTGGRVFITNAVAGQNYRLRVANISNHVTQKDYAEFNSGSPGDGQGDCGGPGREIDPNTGGTPVEPAPTPGLPEMGCGSASAGSVVPVSNQQPPPPAPAVRAAAAPHAAPPAAKPAAPPAVALAPQSPSSAGPVARVATTSPESTPASGSMKNQAFAFLAGLVAALMVLGGLSRMRRKSPA